MASGHGGILDLKGPARGIFNIEVHVYSIYFIVIVVLAISE